MKRIVFLALAVVLAGCATMFETDFNPEQVRIVEVIECPDIDKNHLFVLANSWVVDAFISAESVIQFTDKEAGIIKGKYTLTFNEMTLLGNNTYKVRSTLTIEVKNGAARITIADPYWPYVPMITEARFNKNCMPKYLNLITSFKKAMQEPGEIF